MKTLIHISAMLLLATLFLFCARPVAVGTQPSKPVEFPQDWQGHWQGDLVIYAGRGEVQRVPMQLTITPLNDSTFTYHLQYGEQDARPYQLQVLDAANGHYRIDEQNGILLDDYYLGGKLLCRFSVMGSLLLSSLEMRDGQLVFEILAGPDAPAATTGDTIIGQDTIPPVGNYPIRVFQRALLQRVDK